MTELAKRIAPSHLSFKRYPKFNAPRVLLLHGWGFDQRIWENVLTPLQKHVEVVTVCLPGFGDNMDVDCDYSDEQLIALFKPLLAPQTFVIGWSLGGNLAMLLARHFPAQIRGIICLATNPCFVEQAQWPGMAAMTLEQFINGFENQPAKTIKQFVGLNAMGDKNQRLRLARCRELAASQNNPAMQAGLNYLKRIDQRQDLMQLALPVSFYFAEEDVLVPVKVAQELAELGFRTDVIEATGHALPMEDQQPWLTCLDNMLMSYGKPTDKQAIAKAFGSAAKTYDSAASLQVKVADKLLSLLPKGRQQTFVDLGCGTGYCLTKLKEHCDNLIALDLSLGMLQNLKQGLGLPVVGDAENIPLADQSVDLVFSSLAIQWCQTPALLFKEIHRILKPGGRFIFSTLGPESLGELRAAWWGVDSGVHVNGLATWQQLSEQITAFSLELHLNNNEVIAYGDVIDLMRDLKHLGANRVDQRAGSLTTKTDLKRLKTNYERFRGSDGTFPASYSVHYAVIQKLSS